MTGPGRSALRTLGKQIAVKLPLLGELLRERDRLYREVGSLGTQLEALRSHFRFVPPGHYHSPFPSIEEVRRDEHRLFGQWPRTLPGVDLREEAQLRLLGELRRYYAELPFAAERVPHLRYYFDNEMYSYSDAIFLYAMLRHLRPSRYMEVGSGFSSAVALDTNDLFLGARLRCTFIEPFPERLHSLLREGDQKCVDIIEGRLQDVPLEQFLTLEENDVLFIDSSHVAKAGSDVNRIFADILPVLRPGVHVHLHDVFYPFEYPREWVLEGRAWSEAYLLRAFLAFNGAFEVVLFNTFLEHFHQDLFVSDFPLCLKNKGGSIWLRRRP